jgi:anthranilate synthase/aminodeoxychorismate synthase-like glutamine amidotransferase
LFLKYLAAEMIVLIDNYDSFTYNLSDYLQQLHEEVLVYRNDTITVSEIEQMKPAAIVISPGPKTPREAGITMQVVERLHPHIPMMGICLGFQAMGEFFGATLEKADYPIHGKTSLVRYQQHALFENVANPFAAMRYHSLFLQNINKEMLEVIGETEDGVPMAIQHKKFPLYGLQFHPESILTPDGLQIMKNWIKIVGI